MYYSLLSCWSACNDFIIIRGDHYLGKLIQCLPWLNEYILGWGRTQYTRHINQLWVLILITATIKPMFYWISFILLQTDFVKFDFSRRFTHLKIWSLASANDICLQSFSSTKTNSISHNICSIVSWSCKRSTSCCITLLSCSKDSKN